MKKFILFSVLGVFLYSAPGNAVKGEKELVGAEASAEMPLDLTRFQKEMTPHGYDGQIQLERKTLQDILNTINSKEGAASALTPLEEAPKGGVFYPPVRRKTKVAPCSAAARAAAELKAQVKAVVEAIEAAAAAAAPKKDRVAPCSAEPTLPEEAPRHVSASATTPKKRAILVNAEKKLWMSPSYLRTLRRVTVPVKEEATPEGSVPAPPVIAKSLGYYGPKKDVFHPNVRRKIKAAPKPAAKGSVPPAPYALAEEYVD